MAQNLGADGLPLPQSGTQSQAASDLGLGVLLTDKLKDEDEKRKLLLKQGQEQTQPLGILSPASMALFGPKTNGVGNF